MSKRRTRLRLGLFLLLFATQPTTAQDRTYVGGSWNDSASWNPADVPDSPSENAVIDGGGAFSVDIPAITLGNLTIGSNDEVRQNNSIDVTLSGTSFNNDGVYSMLDVGSITDLRIGSAQVAISGAGELVMSNSANNRILGNAATNELVNGASHTIRGAGQIGFNSLTLTNNGLILSDVGTLTMAPGTGTFTNNGTFRADGGTLQLQNGLFNNSSLMEARNGSEVRLGTGAVLIGGTLDSNGVGSQIRINGFATLDGVTNSGLLSIDNAHDPILRSTFTNNGQVNQNDVGSLTDVRIDGNVSLNGSGTWTMSNSANNRWFGLNDESDTLVNGANHAIEGGGQLGSNSLGIRNEGTIDANNGRLTIDPGSNDLDGSGANFLNNNTLQASNASQLRLQGGLFDNVASTIRSIQGATVELNNGAHVRGGTIVTDGSSTVSVIGADVTLEDILNNGTLEIQNAHDPTLVGSLTNNGQVNQNDVGSLTDVQLDGDVTLTGNGTWTMSNSGNNRWFGVAGTEVLTHGSNHTIEGRGQLGTNAMGLDNNGTIDASIGELTIDPSDVDVGNGADVVNNGTMRASGGGRLTLQDGRFINNSVIRAEDASIVTLDAGAHVSGSLSSTGTGLIEVRQNTVTLEDLTITNNSTMRINNAIDPIVKGTFTNNGQVDQADAGSLTDVQLDGNVTLTGNGTWTMSNSGNNRWLGLSADAALTNGQNHTINGRGQLGTDGMGLVNNGTIDANQGELTVDPSDVDLGSGADVVNNGTMRASAGGRLTLQGGRFVNTSVIRAEDASTVTLDAGAHVSGSFSSTGTGLIEVRQNTVTLEDLTLTNNSTMRINNAIDPIVKGTFTNNGQVNQADAGSLTDMRLDGDVTLDGNGIWSMSNSGSNRWLSLTAVATLTNGANHTIEGRGQIGADNIGLVNNGLINGNLIALSINPFDDAAATFTNTGTLRASDGTTISLTGTSRTSNTGTIEALAGSTINGTQAIDELTSTVTAGTYRAINGTLNVAPAGYQPAVNNAVIEAVGTGNNDVLGVFNAGIHENDVLMENNGAILLDDGANLTVSGMAGVVASPGQLLVGNGSTLDVSARTTSFNVPSDTTNAGLFIDGGELRGSGTIVGGVYMPAGTLSPGDVDGEAGLLSIVGDFNMDDPNLLIEAAVTTIELGGYARGTEYDSFDATGDFFGQGELHATLIDNFLPNIGDEFVVATYVEDGNVAGNLWDNYTFNRVQFTLVDRSLGGANRETVLTVLDIRDIDFDGDDNFTCTDVDALVADIAAGTNTDMFDLNFDGVVDTTDLDIWLTDAGAANLSSRAAYLPGDATLDGVVDGQDFIAWNNNRFTPTAAWCSGDFDANGFVDAQDFIIWNDNKFTSSGIQTIVLGEGLGASVASVPEPGSLALLMLGLAALGCRRR